MLENKELKELNNNYKILLQNIGNATVTSTNNTENRVQQLTKKDSGKNVSKLTNSDAIKNSLEDLRKSLELLAKDYQESNKNILVDKQNLIFETSKDTHKKHDALNPREERRRTVKFDQSFINLKTNKNSSNILDNYELKNQINIEEESKLDNYSVSPDSISLGNLNESTSILKYFTDIVNLLNSKLIEKQENERLAQQINLKSEQSLKDQILKLSNIISSKDDQNFILENRVHELNNKLRSLNIEIEELHNFIDGRNKKEVEKEESNINKVKYLKNEKKNKNDCIKVIYVLNPTNENMILKDKLEVSKEILSKFHRIIKDLKKENEKLGKENNVSLKIIFPKLFIK